MAALRLHCSWRELHHLNVGKNVETQFEHYNPGDLAAQALVALQLSIART